MNTSAIFKQIGHHKGGNDDSLMSFVKDGYFSTIAGPLDSSNFNTSNDSINIVLERHQRAYAAGDDSSGDEIDLGDVNDDNCVEKYLIIDKQSNRVFDLRKKQD